MRAAAVQGKNQGFQPKATGEEETISVAGGHNGKIRIQKQKKQRKGTAVAG